MHKTLTFHSAIFFELSLEEFLFKREFLSKRINLHCFSVREGNFEVFCVYKCV